MYEFLILLLFPGAMAFAAASDLVTMRISNWVSAVLVTGFAVMAVWSGMDMATFGMHFAAGSAMLAICFTMFALGWIGGGDAKLFAATALWFGWTGLFEYAFLASVFGGVLTLALLYARDLRMPDRMARVPWISRLHRADAGVPYGIALGIAGLAVYPDTVWMQSLT